MNQQQLTNDGVRGCYPSLEFIPDVSLILGKRNSGKTFFVINDIYPRISDEIADIFVIGNPSSTEYTQITDTIYLSEHLDSICQYLDNTERKNIPKLLIIDDYSNKILQNHKLLNLACVCTDINLKIVIISSCISGLSPHLRSRIRWVLFGNETNSNEIKRNYDIFGQNHFKDLKFFEEHYDIIQGQEFMVMDQGTTNLQLNFVRASKQIKLKKINSPKIEFSEESDLNSLITEVNNTINQLVGIRNKLKSMKKSSNA